jgi:hypothetical protein
VHRINGFLNPFRAPCSQEINRVVLRRGGHKRSCIIAYPSQVVTSVFRSWLRTAAADPGDRPASSKDSISWARAVPRPPWPWQQPCYSRASSVSHRGSVVIRLDCAKHRSSCQSCHRLAVPFGILHTRDGWGSFPCRWDRTAQDSRETGTSADCNLVWANPGTSSCVESVDRQTRRRCGRRKDCQTCRTRPWRVRR